MPPTRWSADEVRELVADYLGMLDATLRGDRVNKAEHWRALQSRLAGRTRPSIEMKHQNVSAVLLALDLDYLDGYVPLRNYERKILPEIVKEALAARPELIDLMRLEASRPPADERKRVGDHILREVEPPPRAAGRGGKKATPGTHITPARDWAAVAEAEARNRDLGRAGEEAVVEHERRRLHDLGCQELSRRVRHVAVEIGDGLGYDVASFEAKGTPRLIEVKTTRRAAMTPFYVSPNEVAVSQRELSRYYLYRVFRFEYEASLFVLRGDLARTCRLEATGYRAQVA